MLSKKNPAKVVGIGYFSNDQNEAPMLWKKISPESNMFFFGVSCIILSLWGVYVQYEQSNVANVNISQGQNVNL